MPTRHQDGVSSYPSKFLRCRKNGHAWDDLDWHEVFDGPRNLVGYDEILVCLRCASTKTIEYDTDLYRIAKPKITYVDGYLIAKDGEPLSRLKARQESLFRKQYHSTPTARKA